MPLAFSGTAMGQLNQLDATLRHAQQLGDGEKESVRAFVAANSTNLSNADPMLIKKDRGVLLTQLADSKNSAAFRIEYSRQLEPLLSPLVTNANEIVAVNALTIAGDLATAPAANMLLQACGSEKPAVRYQAAYGLRRTFEALGKMPTPTMREDQAADTIKAMGAKLVAESDALVTDGLVLAMIEAAGIGQYRPQALPLLYTSMTTKVKGIRNAAAPEAMLRAVLRTNTGLRDVLTAATSGQVGSETLKGCAEFAAESIAYCVRTVEAKAMPADKASREAHAQLASAAETVILLSLEQQGGKPPAAKKIGDNLKAATTAGDAQFSVDARSLIGPGGLLSKDPYKFPDSQFLSGK
ncbi:MAG: HEAT repeat domain-containing protein [Planctomycetes bacterium]|nr:HEAT repeat domain-containing protein [Planctomycetota bacterium]